MPMYTYLCQCGHRSEEFMKMSTPSDTTVCCPKCNYGMLRVPSLPHTDLQEFHKPVELYSIALEDLGEVRAFKQRCPDVDMSDDPADPLYGVPVARSRKAKLQALAAAGFEEGS